MSLRRCKKAKNHASTLKIEIKLIIAANINVTEHFYSKIYRKNELFENKLIIR